MKDLAVQRTVRNSRADDGQSRHVDRQSTRNARYAKLKLAHFKWWEGTKPKEAHRLFDGISVWPRPPTLSVWVLLILIVNDHQVIQAEEREASCQLAR